MSYNTFPALPGLGWPVKETPKFATIQQQAVSGARYLTSLMSLPLRTIEVPINYLSQADRNTLRNFFLQQLGSGVPFYLTPSQYSYAINQVNFGTLDGTTTAFKLKDSSGNAVQSATVSSIYRTDWQGRQLLYSTARKNQCNYSTEANQWFVGGGTTLGTAAPSTPGGATTAYTFVAGTTSNSQVIITHTNAYSANSSIGLFFDAAPYGYEYGQLGFALNTGGVNGGVFDFSTGAFVSSPSTYGSAPATNLQATATPLPNGYWRITLSFDVTTPQTGLNNSGSYNIFNSPTGQVFAGDGTHGVYLANCQIVADAPLGSLITTVSPLTVTDYTLSGTTVTVGQASPSGATLDWSGTASDAETYLVTFPDSIDFSQFMANMYETSSLKFEEFR